MNKELTLQEAALAWAQGKRVECLTPQQTEYLPISRVGTVDGAISPTCFGDRIQHKFRLAPELPKKRYRAWQMEEVPLGAQIRFPDWDDGCRLLICGAWDGAVMWATRAGFTYKIPNVLLEGGWLHSIDNGKTWLPCGVEVEL